MPGQVIVESGHMVDLPGRPNPRFPPEAVPRVTAGVARLLDEWRLGAQDLVISQGAGGADLIVAHQALRRGAPVRLMVARPVEEFRARSVAALPGPWAGMFDELLNRADRVEVLPADGSEGNPYARANRWALQAAVDAASPQPPRALALWDGQDGDGTGGTADFVRTARGLGVGVHVLDPRSAWRDGNRPYWERQWAAGPKRLLALDGGGMRGLLTLEVLRRVEEVLGGGSPDFVLADYFDYIAGTSTGAIIASALALGRRVEDVVTMYEQMGPEVFRSRRLPGRLKSLYKEHALSARLADYFGEELTLGDDRLRTLLLVVLHRADSDSIWPLSNNTRAKYNGRDRRDCNLAFPLWQVVRGSTAAPVYFPPESIDVGGRSVLFEDGGVTPFNNPALLLFEMATAPNYRLGWPVGPQNLLLVSVGSGFAPATHEGLVKRQVNLFFSVRNLLKVVMNGSGVENDRLCRVLGATRFGPPVDSEFDEPAPGNRVPPLFSYVRYTADLSAAGLRRLGLDGIEPARIGKLDAVDAIGDLQRVGRRVAEDVHADHFAGFAPGS